MFIYVYSTAESRNKQGTIQYQVKQYHNAILFYSQAIQLQPQVAKYYGNRSACYIMLDDYIRGLQDAKKAVELDAGYLKGYMRIVTCCMASGDLQYAQKTLLTARGIFTESTEVRVKLALVTSVQQNEALFKTKMEQKKYKEALEYIDICIAESPKCLNYTLRRAECLIYLDKFDQAEAIAADVLKHKRQNEDAMYIQALSKYYRDDSDKTYSHLVALKRELPDHPKTTRLYRNASQIKATNAEIDKAIASRNYVKAYELISAAIKVDDSNKYTNRRLYQKKIDVAGKVDSLLWNGTRDCTDFMAMYGFDLKILAKRAEYNMKMEEYEDAITDYEEIINKEPTNENREKLREAKEMFDAQIKSDYKILKVPEKCTAEQVKKSFRDLTKQYHPDKNGKITPERKKILENKIIRIREAQKRLLQALKK